MRLYIIRHADPDYPNNTITPAGHAEAQALGRRLSTTGLTRLYSSPLPRALHTAQYTANLTKLPINIEEWTAELSDCRLEMAPWGNLTAWDVPGEVIRVRQPYPTADNWQQIPYFANPVYQERFETVRQNSDAFLARLGYQREGGRYRIVNSNREKIAVFCHGGLGLTWLAHLLEIPLPLMWSGFWLAPSSVTTILFDERSAQWAVPRCIGLGDVSHLYESHLPVQPAGIKANFE